MSKDPKRNGEVGRFIGVGAGPGDKSLLTLQAVETLANADVVFYASGANSKKSVSGGILDSLPECHARKEELVFSMAPDVSDRKVAWRENAVRVIRELEQGHNCVFVTIGDPLFYSTYTYLMREVREMLPDVSIQTVPGITSFQAAAAKANIPLVEDREILAVIPAWTRETNGHPALDSADTLVLLKTYHHKDKIIEMLKKRGIEGEIVYAARVGLEGEIVTADESRIAEHPDEYLSMLVVKRKKSDRNLDQ